MDITEQVRSHYAAQGLVERIRDALAEVAPEDAMLKPEQLAGLDQFHTRGITATLDLAREAALRPGERVLDAGCGVGGPARLLASRFGVSVTGVDLSPSFVEAGRYLTDRCGLRAQVTFEVGDARLLRAEDGAYEAVFLQHVAMNIADRPSLYRETRRVLATGGRFATYDIVRAGGEPHYPVPWAGTPKTSFLFTADETQKAIETARFRPRVWRDDTGAAKTFFAEVAQAGPPPGPTLSVLIGPEFRAITGNLARSIMEGQVAVFMGVFEAV